MRLVVAESGRVVAGRLEKPRSFLGRGIGLLFRGDLDRDRGMWIDPCRSIHMLGMRFAIDAVFLDRGLRVVRIDANLRPWRMVPLVWRARSVVELAAGRAAEVGLRVGDAVRIEAAER